MESTLSLPRLLGAAAGHLAGSSRQQNGRQNLIDSLPYPLLFFHLCAAFAPTLSVSLSLFIALFRLFLLLSNLLSLSSTSAVTAADPPTLPKIVEIGRCVRSSLSVFLPGQGQRRIVFGDRIAVGSSRSRWNARTLCLALRTFRACYASRRGCVSCE